MDWTEQSEAMINNWMDMQKKMWDTFFTSMPEFNKSPSQKVWEQAIETGQLSLKNTLAAQKEWLGNWVEYLGTLQGVPEQVLDSARQMQDMADRWAETQEQLWQNWFDVLKKFDMSKVSSGWMGAVQDPYQMWKDNTQKIMQAQAEWMNTWMKMMGGKADEG